jgi:hypothetical protein
LGSLVVRLLKGLEQLKPEKVRGISSLETIGQLRKHLVRFFTPELHREQRNADAASVRGAHLSRQVAVGVERHEKGAFDFTGVFGGA